MDRGFIRAIIVIIIALIVLGYFFNIRITDILGSADVSANLNWFWGLIIKIWNIITWPFVYVWNTFVV